MDQGVDVDSPVTLVIKAPNQKYDDQKIDCFLNWTVERLKGHLSNVYPSKPSSKDQRLVYSGKLLLDHLTLRQVLRKHDEYHMVHLVCASRTPPGSPTPTGSRSNGPPGESTTTTSTSSSQSNTSPSPSQEDHSAAGGNNDGLRHRAHALPNYPMHPAFIPGYMWGQFPSPPGPANAMPADPTYPTAMPADPTAMPAYPTYSSMTLLWWQQLYARQYYMHYQQMATAPSHHDWPVSAHQSGQSNHQNAPPPEDRRGDPEVQLNEVLNEEEGNRDWLDWVYTVSRAAVLLSIVYFYSSFSRFVMVMGAMLLLYLHQAGWFPFNLENDLQNPADAAHQDDLEAEIHHDLQEMERVMDDGLADDDGESGEEGVDDPNGIPHAGFLSSTWSFIITFFMSLIPEGPPNAAN